MNQKHRYGQFMPVSQGLIWIYWFGNIMHFACQDWSSCIKISQITFFSCVFSGKETLAHGESKILILQLMPVSQGLICIYRCGSITFFACQDLASRINISQITYFSCVFPWKRPLHMVNQNTDIPTLVLWIRVWFPYSGVVLSCLLPVKTWLHASKDHKLPVFSVLSQEQRPFHMVNQKHGYGQLMPVSQGLICI